MNARSGLNLGMDLAEMTTSTPRQAFSRRCRRSPGIPGGAHETRPASRRDGFFVFWRVLRMSDVPFRRGFTTAILHGDRGAAIEHGALHKPLHLSVAYGYSDARDLAAMFQGRQSGFVYGRQGNPTLAALEAKVNAMEEGVATVCFATGISAIVRRCERESGGSISDPKTNDTSVNIEPENSLLRSRPVKNCEGVMHSLQLRSESNSTHR
jgi:hypothetical protein